MIPDFQTIMLPLLKFLGTGPQYPMTEVLQNLSKHFGLSEDDLRVRVPSGQQPLFKNRVTWAISYLKTAGFINYPQRGVYKLTEKGKELLQEKVDSISISYLKKLNDIKKWQNTNAEENPDTLISYPANEEVTPDELLGNTIKTLHEKLALDLLSILKGKTAAEFERFVLMLLNQMGYGTLEERSYEVVGKSGDNGIDGIIYQDQFGLDRVYVQAKKWADSKVQSKDIRDFIGALSLKGTNKGVFITTSEFTPDAYKTAQLNPQNRIILINGVLLSDYAIKHNVGVQIKAQYEVKTLDNDFFEDL
ncbi:restriction endonuclease [Niastella yeongjuensis]|nr:restriction endonuclease [Niastella yeongjuensis]SEP18856.1 restriction system protein [Niastella yeongjuensis]